MRADSFYLIRKHPVRGFAAVIGCAKANTLPEVTEKHESFANIEDALTWAGDEYAEFGVDIHPECYDGIAESVTPKAYTELSQWAFSNGEVHEHEAHWASDGLNMLAMIVAEARGETRLPHSFGHLLTANCGAEEFETDVFVLRPYCWCDGELGGHEFGCPPNFIHKPSGLMISWYKNAERGITANQSAPTAICWWLVLNDCVSSISRAEVVLPLPGYSGIVEA